MSSKHTFSICFFIKKSTNKTHYPLIYLQITVDGIREEISCKHRTIKEKWNSQKGRVNGFSEFAKTINQHWKLLKTKPNHATMILFPKTNL